MTTESGARTGQYTSQQPNITDTVPRRFCEFTGDDEHTFDEPGFKKLCEHAGFRRCVLHNRPLREWRGWRVCCQECTTPIQIKEVK